LLGIIARDTDEITVHEIEAHVMLSDDQYSPVQMLTDVTERVLGKQLLGATVACG
jgi:hypothetical protein